MTDLNKITFDWVKVHAPAPAPALNPDTLADTIRDYARQFPIHERTPGRLEVGRIVWLRLGEIAAPSGPMFGRPPITALYGLSITTPDDIAPDAWRLIATDGTVLREGRVTLP